MHEHDLDVEAAGPDAARRRKDELGPAGDADIGRGVEAGRPDTLGPGGLLRLQQVAGNSGVAGLVAQRRATGEDEHAPEEPSPVHDVVGSQGSPLEPGVRRQMESAVGADFGDVRVHTDTRAAESARSVQAHAYTVGNHVVFGEGTYRPETAEGRHTLAHELTHVVQQRQGPVDGTPAAGGIKVSDPSDRFEREAESNAAKVTSGSGGTGSEPTPAAAPAVQRQEDREAAPAPVQRQAVEEDEVEEVPPAETEAEGAPPEVASEAPEETEEEPAT